MKYPLEMQREYLTNNILAAVSIGNPLVNFCTVYISLSGFDGLGVACWPLVPKFAVSNPAEAVGFLRAKKSSARLDSEGK
jgi:hypothetical protein